MSRTAERKKKKKRVPGPRKPPAAKPMTDRAVYLGFIIVGFFLTMLVWLFTEGRYWRPVALGYIIAGAYLMNFYVFQVYRGRHLEHWQQSLARLPLRFAGYGTKGGKPLEAAHDHQETKKTLLVSIAVSAAIVVLLSFVLIPGLLPI
jgi:hypothetical protein